MKLISKKSLLLPAGHHPLWQDRPQTQPDRGVLGVALPNLHYRQRPHRRLLPEDQAAGRLLSEIRHTP